MPSCDAVDLILRGFRLVRGGFWKVDSSPPYLAPCRKPPLMRSTRRTTGHLSENSVVDNLTEAFQLQSIFATFLVDSSASLGRPYFYLIQSNGWKRNERIMGGGLTIHNNQPHGQMHFCHRGGVISMMMMMTMMTMVRTTAMRTITTMMTTTRTTMR